MRFEKGQKKKENRTGEERNAISYLIFKITRPSSKLAKKCIDKFQC
jgi:hypothetical protein